MRLVRPPRPELRSVIASLWIADTTAPGEVEHENVLPTGEMHIAIRLCGSEVKIGDGPAGVALVGGARNSFYRKAVTRQSRSVGAVLRPGASQALFGIPAGELAHRHTSLDDLCRIDTRESVCRINEAMAPLDAWETILMEHLARLPDVKPVIPAALKQLERGVHVRDVVDSSGYSHRRFIALFRDAVGLTPKRYARVRRFQRLLSSAAAGRAWVEAALDAGYSDQSHANREFLELAGITPTQYLASVADRPLHVPMVRSNLSKSSQAGRRYAESYA